MIPLVAVPGRRLGEGRPADGSPPRPGRTPQVAAGRRYLDALRTAGVRGAVLAPEPLDEPAAAVELLEPFAGVLLMGGGDVDPALYGATPAPETAGVRPEIDAFELAIVRAALATGRPVLAVCRGLQLLNVALGGSLHQHVEGHRPQPGEPDDVGVLRRVHVTPESRLGAAVQTGELTGACSHHQAVDRLGEGLRVVARADDGTVEGVELDQGWVVGVQWHPEDTAATDPVQRRLFDAFAAQLRPA